MLYPGVKVSVRDDSADVGRGRGTSGAVQRAGLAGRGRGRALDEMFSQGEPVLAGVDLDSGYLFGLSLSATRDGRRGRSCFARVRRRGWGCRWWSRMRRKGIAAGVSEVFPHAEQRDDCFQCFYEMTKVRRRLERRAYSAIERGG